MVFASNLISVLTSSHITKEDENLMLMTETFISELLNLTKASIMDNKVHMVISSYAPVCSKYNNKISFAVYINYKVPIKNPTESSIGHVKDFSIVVHITVMRS